MAIALLLSLALVAQVPGAQPATSTGVVRSVEVRLPAGANPHLLERLSSLVAVRQGQELSLRSVQRTIEALASTEQFSDIEVKWSKVDSHVALAITLSPRRAMVEVYAEGNTAVSTAEILKASQLEPGSEYWVERLAAARDRVVGLYQSRGYRDAQVGVSAEESSDVETPGIVVGFAIQEGLPTRVQDIAFEGDPGLAASRLLEAFQVRPQDVADQRALDRGQEAVRLLLRQERFFSARVMPPQVQSDGRVVIRVMAGPRFRVVFRGNRHVRDFTLSKVLAYDGEELLDRTQRWRLEKRLERFYRFRGFHRVRVTASETRRPGGRQAQLSFMIEEGLPTRVVGWKFEGNRSISDQDLRDVLGKVMEASAPQESIDVYALGDPMGLDGHRQERLGEVLPSPPLEQVFEEEAWAEAVKSMTALYRQRGFLSASVRLGHVEMKGRRATAHFVVEEGPRAYFRSTQIDGLPLGADPRVLTLSRQGRVFSAQELERLRLALLKELNRGGFAFAEVDAGFSIHDEGRSVDVTLAVRPGPPVRVNRIVVAGNERTVDDVLLGQATLREGQLLDVEELAKTQARLMDLGILRSAEVEMLSPDVAEPMKTVVLKVRERARVSGEIGLGYFFAEGPRVVVDVSAPNVAGRAMNLSGHVQINFFPLSAPALSQQVDVSDLEAYKQIGGRGIVSLSLPSLLPQDFGLRGDLIGERVFRKQFRFTRYALAPTLDWRRSFDLPWSEDLMPAWGWLEPKLAISAQYELDLSLVERTGTPLGSVQATNILDQERLRFLFGTFLLQTVRLSPTLDFRDSQANPRRGLLIQGSADLTGALYAQDLDDRRVVVNFLKVSGLATGYLPFGSRLVLAISARAGRIFPLVSGSVTPPVKRFFLGGATSMRGFTEDQLIAEDLRAQYRQEVAECSALFSKAGCSVAAQTVRAGRQVPSQGGELFALVKAELRFPIYKALDLGTFFEAGNLWLSEPSRLWPLRTVAGAGLRYATPVGLPLAFDVGVNLGPDATINESIYNVHFNIGVF